MSLFSLISIFSGRSRATSLFTRRKKCRPNVSCISLPIAIRSVSSFLNGLWYFAAKAFAFPNSPGTQKSMMHHKSKSVFSTGVPVIAILNAHFRALAAFVTNVPGVLIFCASSSTTTSKSTAQKFNCEFRIVS